MGNVNSFNLLTNYGNTRGISEHKVRDRYLYSNSNSVCYRKISNMIEEKCARTLEFPFSATRGENTANSAFS